MSKKRYSYHPACLAFPVMREAELQHLADDIKRQGLLNPIVLHQGKVLDGRNRLAACQIAGVEPRFVEWEGDGSPTEWVVAMNAARRDLTASQRAVVAVGVLPVLGQEAKERQRLSRGRGKKGGKELPTNPGKGKATEIAARLVGTNRQYVQDVKAIQRSAPELVEKIRAGELTVADGKLLARQQVGVRKKVLMKLKEQPGGKLKELIDTVQGKAKGARGNGATAPMTAAWTGKPETVPEPEEPQEEPAEEIVYVITAVVSVRTDPDEFEDLSRTGQARWEVRNGKRRLLANVQIEEIERA